ncbi:MAG: phosphatidate cytidylyltransferase [Ferrimonas sp.]
MLKQRVLTALVLLPLALAVIFALPLQGFALVLAVVFALAGREFGALIAPQRANIKIMAGLVTIAILALVWALVPMSQVWQGGELHPLYLSLIYAGTLWWLVALGLVLSFPLSALFWQRKPLLKSLFGLFTLLPAFCAMVALKSWPGSLDGAWLILAVLLLVWGADTGAYFIGKRFGKKKLIPKVSPAKTREGLFGGMFVCALLCVVAWQFVPNISLFEAIILGMVTAFVSALGDLTESMFKRAANIKDSGRLLPGHGGVLDRIDSVTAAMPVFTTLLLLFGLN